MPAIRSPHLPSMILCFVLAMILLTACGPSPRTPPPSASSPSISWELTPVTTFTHPSTGANYQLLRIGKVNGVVLPTPEPKKALDVLILGAGSCTNSSGNPCGYDNVPLAQFYEDVKPFMQDVFGAANVLGTGSYGGPFNFYVTDYEYSQATPVTENRCDPGLPEGPNGWVLPSNVTFDGPAFGCNIALSTVAPHLNIGFIVHRGDIRDRNKFNLFSAEYNSYAAILHELSHAAFVMSDEAPSAEGRFFPMSYPNLYNGPCPTNSCAGGLCEGIGSGFYHCTTGPAGNNSNLMYFATPVPPGNNNGWTSYVYQFASKDRLNFIYGKCTVGGC